jgi:hypothetical protein
MSKYCIDCKHLEQETLRCRRPWNISLVTGKMTFNTLMAEVERSLELTGCGSVGKYFEPVETIEEIPFGGQAK